MVSMSVASVSGSAMPSVVSGASMQAPPQQKMTSLFDKIDTSSTGSISQAQFDQAFQTLKPPAAFQAAGADAIWSRLDPSGSGSVSQQDFVNTMKSLMAELRQPGSKSGAQSTSSATQALNLLGSSRFDVKA
jgi:Ca2+-binding EF-hand superfamily protein